MNQPSRSDFPSEIDFARAMQRWALQEVPRNNSQRLICINDWFAEEFLIDQAQTADRARATTTYSPKP